MSCEASVLYGRCSLTGVQEIPEIKHKIVCVWLMSNFLGREVSIFPIVSQRVLETKQQKDQ